MSSVTKTVILISLLIVVGIYVISSNRDESPLTETVVNNSIESVSVDDMNNNEPTKQKPKSKAAPKRDQVYYSSPDTNSESNTESNDSDAEEPDMFRELDALFSAYKEVAPVENTIELIIDDNPLNSKDSVITISLDDDETESGNNQNQGGDETPGGVLSSGENETVSQEALAREFEDNEHFETAGEENSDLKDSDDYQVAGEEELAD